MDVFTIPDLKLYYRAIMTKTAWHWHNNRHIDQGNWAEDPDMKPQTYGQLIFDKEARNAPLKKMTAYSINDAGQTGWLLVEECK